MKSRTLALLLMLGVLTACTVTVPVRGRIEGFGTMLVGETTGYMDHTGTIHLTSQDGRDCRGDFHYTGDASGVGAFTCQDGSTGTFNFNSSGLRGAGFGQTSKGEHFRFVFGNQSSADPEI